MSEPVTAYFRVSLAGNGKPRPAWFSRRLALQSFLVAAERVDAEVVVVADGGVPQELADLVPGRVEPVVGGSAAKSWRALLDVVDTRDGLVWLAEDDHVHLPHALEAVRTVAAARPDADWFSTYTPDNSAWHAASPSQPGRPREPATDGWRRSWDCTSSFGVRAPALRAASDLLRLASRSGGPWDNAVVLSVQGERPYPVRALHRDLFLRPSRASAGRVLTRPLLRAAVDLLSLGRTGLWLAPERDLSTHAEVGHVSPDADWAQLALTMSTTKIRSALAGMAGGEPCAP